MNGMVRSVLMALSAAIGMWTQGEVVTLRPDDIGTVNEDTGGKTVGGLTLSGNWGYYDGNEQGWFVAAGSSVSAPSGRKISRIVITADGAQTHVYGLADGWTRADNLVTWSGVPAKAVDVFATLEDPEDTVEIFDYSQIAVTLEASNVTVTFNPSSVATLEPIASQSLAVGAKVARPADPVDADGRRDFGGWCREGDCRTLWDFASDTVSDDTELFARWTDKTKPLFSGSGAQGDPWVLNELTPLATNLLLRKGAVARIGNAWYADLQHAFDVCATAATAPVVTLVADAANPEGAFVAKGASVLDLAGFDVSCASFAVGDGVNASSLLLKDSGVDGAGVLSASSSLTVPESAAFEMRGGALAQTPTVSEGGSWRVYRGFFDAAVPEGNLAPGCALHDGTGSGYAYAVAPAVSAATLAWQVTPGTDFNGATVSGVLSDLSYGGSAKAGTLTVRVTRNGSVVATKEVSVSGFVSRSFRFACEDVAAQDVYDCAISFTASGDAAPCASDERKGVVAAKAFAGWIAENAETFAAGGATGEWRGEGAAVEAGKISFDSEAGVNFDVSPVSGCRYRIVSKMAFGGPAEDDPTAADAQAGVKMASAGDTARFCCLVGGTWVTNDTVAAELETEYEIGITFDYVNRLVSYDVGGVALAAGAITGSRSGVSGLQFVGPGFVDAVDGDYWDSNLVEAGGEEYASVDAALAAGRGTLAAEPLALLWDATWRPAADIAGGTYYIAPGGRVLTTDDSALAGAGRTLTDNGDGSYTVSAGADDPPETAEAIAEEIGKSALTTEAAEAARAKVMSVSGGDDAEAQALAQWMKDKSLTADELAAGDFVEASFHLGTELLDEGDTVAVTALTRPTDDGTVAVSFQIRGGGEAFAIEATRRAIEYAGKLLRVGADPGFTAEIASTCSAEIDGATRTVTVTATPIETRTGAFYKVEIPSDARK